MRKKPSLDCSGQFILRGGEEVVCSLGEWTLIKMAHSKRPAVVHGNYGTDNITYGVCVSCGVPIPQALMFVARMEAI